MIEAGYRTRTTRSAKEMAKYNIKVGDIVRHYGKSADGSTKEVFAVVTAIHPKGSSEFTGTWINEGWTPEGLEYIKRFKDGAAAIEFDLIDAQSYKQGLTNVMQQAIDGISHDRYMATDFFTQYQMVNYKTTPMVMEVEDNHLIPSEKAKGQYELNIFIEGVLPVFPQFIKSNGDLYQRTYLDFYEKVKNPPTNYFSAKEGIRKDQIEVKYVKFGIENILTEVEIEQRMPEELERKSKNLYDEFAEVMKEKNVSYDKFKKTIETHGFDHIENHLRNCHGK